MIAIIRVAGRVGIRRDAVETFNRLGIKKKYSCIVFPHPTPQELGMLGNIKDMVAFGEVSKENYERLVKERGQKKKDVFRLHPPRGGVKSTKMHYPKGILGDNGKDINKLIEKML